MLTLITLGGLTLTAPDGEPTRLSTRRRALALLAMAAAASRDGVSRDRAMALLWPELDTASARNNLKQTVFSIRHTLGVEVFDHESANLRLDPRQIAVDLQHFERAVGVGAHDDVVNDYGGPFLDGFFAPNLREFERWVERVRQRVALEYARALESLAVKARLNGQAPVAAHWYRRLVDHDPLSTTAVLGLIATLADAGEPLEALEHFRRYRELLREDFDAPPDRRVLQAAERVRQRLTYRSPGPGELIHISGEFPSMPPLFVEPERTTRRTSGPVSSPAHRPQLPNA